MPLKQDSQPEVDWVGIRAYINALGELVAKNPLSRWKRSRGQAVRLVQRHLNSLGYECGPVDGIFGRMTAGAVKEYQFIAKLKANGVVDKATWNRMFL
jgi:N-acetyl-anhydromuramyl-L-alanine amidase AmpD